MHLSGNESDGEPANLAWGCKSCNGKLGAAFRTIGAGRPTNQYNPASGHVPTFEQYKWAVTHHIRGEHDEGGAVIHATPKHKRIEYAKRIAAFAAPARRAASAQRRQDFEDRWNPAPVVGHQGKPIAAECQHCGQRVTAKIRKGSTLSWSCPKCGGFNSTVRENPWPFSSPKGRSARDTTPASGGIAKFSHGRGSSVTAPARSKKKSAPAAGFSRVPDEKTIQEGFKRGLSLVEILRQNPGIESRSFMKGVAAGRKLKGASDAKLDQLAGAWIQGAGFYGPSIPYERDQYRAGLQAAVDDYQRARAKNPGPDPWARFNDLQKQGFMKPGKKKMGTLYRAYTPHGVTYTGPDKHTAERHVREYGEGKGRVEKFRGELNPAGKRNPAGSAAEVFTEFHGFEPSEVIEVTKRVFHHEHLASAGKLTHLEIAGIDGKAHKVTGFRGSILAFNESKNQLFVEGGDQSINLGDFGIRKPHELETLGELTDIGYQTNKTHLGDEGGHAVYVHKLRSTNENGRHVIVKVARNPHVIYDVRNEQILFSGGSYEILREGINK
jgi:hypothetical protein